MSDPPSLLFMKREEGGYKPVLEVDALAAALAARASVTSPQTGKGSGRGTGRGTERDQGREAGSGKDPTGLEMVKVLFSQARESYVGLFSNAW